MKRLAFLLASAGLAIAAAQGATPAIDGGARHSVALGADGKVRTWGDDGSGQLGIGRALASGAPAAVAGATNVCAVSAGDSFALAMKCDGLLIAWGDNANGQLGDGTTTRRSSPVAVTGVSGAVEISARGGHSVARLNDGSVWEWGLTSPVPTRVEGIDNVVQISAGGSFTLARKADGTVWAWGENDHGQLGDGTQTEPYTGRYTVAPVSGLTGVVDIAAGYTHSLARLVDGTVIAWGENDRGELGDGTTTDRLLPVRVSLVGRATLIAAGSYHSIAMLDDGSVLGWGGDGYAELGDGTYGDSQGIRPLPVPLTGLAGATAISTGFLHSFARMPGGTLVAWGVNDYGQLGDPSIQRLFTPTAVNVFANVKQVVVGDVFTIALKDDGTVWAWGSNDSGQLGNAAFVFRSTPNTVALSGVQKVSAGGFHVLALESDGSVWAWGDNRAEQIGDGTLLARSSPLVVTGLGPGSGVVELAGGGIHSLARKSDGSIYSWGDNFSSQLGPRDTDDTSIPGRVTAISNAIAIAAGGSHSVALLADHTVWTWGANESGQLGDGTRSALYQGRLVPMQVAGVSGITAISAGDSHTVVLKSDGTVLAWGANRDGQLGDGTRIDRLTPVQVTGLSDVQAISAGSSHTLALKRDGTVWAWGANYSFALGDGTSDDHATPVPVPGLTHVVAISASSQSLALKDDGSVWAWGGNESGQLGDGTLVDRASPIVVLREGGAGTVAGNDWFLDLDPSIATTIAPENIPIFLVVASSAASNVTANLKYRAQDVNTTASVFVFALAPQTLVKETAASKAVPVGIVARGTPKDAPPVQCVLAQLNASGQLVGVTASSLQAYITGVLSSQGQAVTILNGVPTATIGGATFFVGYGSTGTSMISGGTNRGVVSVPGNVSCQPQAPQTGWWWNPAEDGRGFSIEVRGSHYFFASFLYDVSGRSTWYVSTGAGVSLDGSLITGDLLSASGGQTLGGPYPGSPTLTNVGTVTLTFNDASHGSLVWPGGLVPIERFNIVQNGLTLPAVANQPENGWWWNPNESGRGFFMEWQGGVLDIAGYLYDESGNSIWVLTEGGSASTNPRSFASNWWSFANGQTLTGAWKPNVQTSNNVAPVTIQFSDSQNAVMTLPNGRTTALIRHRF